MNIGIIGSGEMGRCLASKFVALGHAVSLANSRGPASIKKIAAGIGANAVTVEEAIKDKQVIIVSIPQKNIPALAHLFKDLPANVVVVETGNYYPGLRDGTIPALEQHGIDSLWVQQQLGIPVVKAFNAILATSIHDFGKPPGQKDRIAIPVSGDDTKAKKIVFELVNGAGFDEFDIGPVTQSWKQQPGSPVYCRDINREELKKRIGNMDNDWSVMQDVIIAKRKADEVLMLADYPAYLESLQ
jgi:8-hydroxy-5-deazaflavin:NADPH oxidoreductase